jgi:YVTN family beta-propeller protein
MTVSQGPGELAVFSTASNSVGTTVKVGKLPHWVAASGDSRTAYTTNEGSNDVSIVDLASGGVTTVPVGNAPRKIAVQQGSMGSASAGASSDSSAGAVKIAGFAFAPASVELKAGQSITWTNDDGAPHAISVKGGASSPILAPGETHSMKFDKPGSYDYVCSVHPYMTGRIMVR